MAKRKVSGDSQRAPVGNRLLAALPEEERRRILNGLDTVALPVQRPIYKPGDAITYVYFPSDGFFSVLTVLRNGDMVEVTTVGSEGAIGASVDGMRNSETSLTMVQGAMESCYRMPAQEYRREMKRGEGLFSVVTRYNQALMGVVMQGTACNAVHSIEQRLARWLLMAHDRMAKDLFPLTQEFLAMMLGAARPTVTIVAGILQRKGLITYRRGQLTVVDRKGLEQASCECYRATTNLLAIV